MGEKKEIKVSLGTVICSMIIVVLLLAIVCMWLYYNTPARTQDKTTGTSTVAKNNTPVKTNETKPNIILFGDTDIANAKPSIYWDGFRKEKFEDYYNTEYDVYIHSKNVGKTKGTVIEYESELSEGKCYTVAKEKHFSQDGLNNPEVFVSCDYNVVPRTYESKAVINNYEEHNFPANTSFEAQSIDLDGDGKKEYLVIYKEPNDVSGFSLVGYYLLNSNYAKIGDLYSQYARPEDIDFDNIIYMDIDKDNIMEIIIIMPKYGGEGIQFGIYKYQDESLRGRFIMKDGAGP